MNAEATPDTRLHGRWLWFARAAWLAVTALTLGLYIAKGMVRMLKVVQ